MTKDDYSLSPVGSMHLYDSSQIGGHTPETSIQVYECNFCGSLVSTNGKVRHTAWHTPGKHR